MTKEEKINWLRKATNEELLLQYEFSVRTLGNDSIAAQIEAQEDVELAREEILRRILQPES